MVLTGLPYSAAHTPVHQLDARVKVVALLAFSIAVFFVDSWWGMAMFAVVAMIPLVEGRVPFRQVAASLVPVLFLAAFSVAANALAAGEQGAQTGLFMACRVVLLALASFSVCFTTSSADLLAGFRSLLSPLRVVRVPVDDIAFTLSLAVRFIPVIAQEFDGIRRAQRARGGEVTGVGFARAVAVYANSFTSLFVGLFRHADSLVSAMSARCYGAVPVRSALVQRRLGVADVCCLVVVCALCLLTALFL